jgi:hypothetical protein
MLHNEKVHHLHFAIYYNGDQIKEVELERTCRMHERNEQFNN